MIYFPCALELNKKLRQCGDWGKLPEESRTIYCWAYICSTINYQTAKNSICCGCQRNRKTCPFACQLEGSLDFA